MLVESTASKNAISIGLLLKAKPTANWGATQDDWSNLSDRLGYTTEMLPVVSNPNAVISAGSRMKRLGKTPSIYNKAEEVAGLPEWTERDSTEFDIARWRKNGDYGICLQTRYIRCIDVDVKDAVFAQKIMDFICARHKFPIRWRADSSKFLMAFRVVGDIQKTVLKFNNGDAIEFLGRGQQFIAHGTHQDGARYEWDWQEFEDFPEMTLDEYKILLAAIAEEFGLDIVRTAGAQRKAKDNALVAGDDVTSYLHENGLALGDGRDGSVYFECPWSAGHSVDNGESQTAYFPPGRGYQRGHFKCFHQGCAQYTHTDFIEALGIADTYFDVIEDEPDADGNTPEPPKTIIKDARDWYAIAGQITNENMMHDGVLGLRYAQQIWYQYKGHCYEQKEQLAVEAFVGGYLNRALKVEEKKKPKNEKGDKEYITVPFKPNRNSINEVVSALQRETHVERGIAPMWLTKGKDASEYVAMRDGLLHLPTQKLQPHTANFFNTNALPFNWKDSEGEPVEWLRFLDSLWGHDPESITTLQTIFGYLMTGDTSEQKMFIIKGPPRSGKGTIVRVLRSLFGAANTVDTSFVQLSHPDFGLESLIGKTVAFLPEARNTGNRHGNIQVAVERMLSISGEDNVSVNRKHKTAWQGKLPTRFFMVANELPALGDSSGAFASRFIPIEATVSFLGREDVKLEGRLLAELPQIMRWGLAGQEILRSQGRFLIPPSAEKTMTELADVNNPVREFLRDVCEVGPGLEVERNALYAAYGRWSEAAGRRPEQRTHFMNALLGANLQIKAHKTKRCYKNIHLVIGLRVKNDDLA